MSPRCDTVVNNVYILLFENMSVYVTLKTGEIEEET